jgi:hypothetical protein
MKKFLQKLLTFIFKMIPLRKERETMKKYNFPLKNEQKEETEPLPSVSTTAMETADPVTESITNKPNFTRFMIGTFFDPKDGEWKIVQAKFDPNTLTFGTIDVQRVAGDVEIMRERIDIKIIRLGLLENKDMTEEMAVEANLY